MCFLSVIEVTSQLLLHLMSILVSVLACASTADVHDRAIPPLQTEGLIATAMTWRVEFQYH